MKESVYKSFVSGDPHEEELLRQLIRGDIAGYEVLFHKYYPTFFAFIKGMTKETVVAEDITQNIFMTKRGSFAQIKWVSTARPATRISYSKKSPT